MLGDIAEYNIQGICSLLGHKDNETAMTVTAGNDVLS